MEGTWEINYMPVHKKVSNLSSRLDLNPNPTLTGPSNNKTKENLVQDPEQILLIRNEAINSKNMY